MSGVNKFNRQEYREKISKMTDSEFVDEWNEVTASFQEKFKKNCEIVKVVKVGRERRTSTGRRFAYGKVEQ